MWEIQSPQSENKWRISLWLALAYVLTGYLGLQTPAYGTTITLVWLPTGIAVGCLFRWGYSTWPGIALGAFLVNILNGNSIPLAVGISVGNTLGPILAVRLLTAVGFRRDFERNRDVLLLGVAAALGMTVSATGGVACLALEGQLQVDQVGAWLRWWAGDTTGVLLAAPLILSVGQEANRFYWRRPGEFVTWFILVGVVGTGVFIANSSPSPAPLAFLPMPLIVWGAIRFGPIGASVGVILMAFVAASGTSAGLGPFAQSASSPSAALVWVYTVTCVLIAWLAAALTAAQRRTEISLRESEERWKFALEGAGAGMIDWDVASGRVLFSDRWREITGYRPGDLPETLEALKELVHPDDRPHVLHDLDLTLCGSQSVHAVEHRLRCADGRWIWVLSRAVVSRWGVDNAPQRVVGTHQDITDRKQVEEALRGSETRFRHMAENIPGAIIQYTLQLDGSDRVEYMNSACDDVWEVPAEVVRADSGVHWRMVHPDDMEGLRAAIAEGARHLGPVIHSWRITTPSGRLKWLQVYARPEAVDQGLIRWNCAIFDVTTQKRAEQVLRESEERFRLAVEATGAGVWDHWMDYDEIGFSDQLRAIYGLPLDARITLPVLIGLIHPDDRAGFERVAAAAHDPDGDGTYSLDHRIIRPDGEVRWVRSFGRSLFDSHRHPVRSIGIARDVTAQMQIEVALRESEERYRTMFEANPHPMWVYDLETFEFLAVNDAAVVNYGYTREEFLGMTIKDIRPSEDVPALVANVAAVDSGFQQSGVWRHRLKDGRTILVSIASHTMMFAGRPAELVLAHNVTDQLRAEEQLRESEEKLRTIVDNEPECVKLLDRHGRLLEMNPAGLRMIEAADLAQVRGAVVSCLVADADRAAFDDLVASVFRGESRRMTFQMRGLTGTPRVLETHSVPLWSADRTEVRALLGVTRDVTDRVRAEQALRENEEQLRLAVETTRLGIWRHVMQTGQITLNERARAILNLDNLDVSADDLTALLHPGDLERVTQEVGQSIRPDGDGSFATELRIVTRDGTERWLSIRANVRFSEAPAGRLPSTVIGTMMDITERKRAEGILRASLGEKEAMLKEIHHRVKNNLQVISSLLNLQAERIADPAARVVFLESQSRVRAMALVHETLYGSESLAQIELPQYIERLCDSLLQTFGGNERVTVERDIVALGLDLDRAIPVGLIISELVSNALKYAFPGERRGQVRVALAPSGDADLELSISDDGVGLPIELDLDRTTSLGLYLVRVLTRQLHGTLAIGRTGVGVTFTLTFPK